MAKLTAKGRVELYRFEKVTETPEDQYASKRRDTKALFRTKAGVLEVLSKHDSWDKAGKPMYQGTWNLLGPTKTQDPETWHAWMVRLGYTLVTK